MGVFESDLDIYLTNSACVGLRMLGFRLAHGTNTKSFEYRFIGAISDYLKQKLKFHLYFIAK